MVKELKEHTRQETQESKREISLLQIKTMVRMAVNVGCSEQEIRRATEQALNEARGA
jgi:alkylhydroperoxidase/carboxymuconolactone decarboxylase family protein YurZ